MTAFPKNSHFWAGPSQVPSQGQRLSQASSAAETVLSNFKEEGRMGDVREGGQTYDFNGENLTLEACKKTWKTRSEGKTGRRQVAGQVGRIWRLRRNCAMGERRETASEAPLRLPGCETEVCLKDQTGRTRC